MATPSVPDCTTIQQSKKWLFYLNITIELTTQNADDIVEIHLPTARRYPGTIIGSSIATVAVGGSFLGVFLVRRRKNALTTAS
ncbi:MAG TPA: hypothetical protein VMT96_00200 [Candidatus Bathyarchaeia archaeon]|nr:hypothetical protein [Candidatus Bathyarchaeia archaeon]